MKLQEIAERLGCRLEGDGSIEVRRMAGLEEAGPGDLSFFANPRYSAAFKHTKASAVLVPEEVTTAHCALLRTRNPYLAFAEALSLFVTPVRPQPGIDEQSFVAADAVLGSEVSIGVFSSVGRGARIGDRTVIFPNVCIGQGAVIGDDCIIHSHVAIRERVVIGNRVIIQNGAVLGADGYGFVRRPDGTHRKIPQTSGVVIEDDVEIGANTTVDRPAVGETRIRAGAKIDNLVQIGHGVKIGRNVLLAAQAGIAGSTSVGDGAILGGQVGVAGHVSIGRNAKAVGQSGITNSIPDEAFVSGYPAIENKEWLKSSAVFRRLPELRRKIAALEQRLLELEGRIEESRIRSPK